MRFLVKVTFPVETGNAAVRNGSLGKTMDSILGDLKPEAAYFIEEAGKRTAILFVDLQETNQITQVAEPFFLSFDASVEFHPAMSPDDLRKAAPILERVAKTY